MSLNVAQKYSPLQKLYNSFFAGYGITQLILHSGYRCWVPKLFPQNLMRASTKSNVYYRKWNNKEEKLSDCFLSTMKHRKRQNFQRL